jgi:hypothetical protein
MDNGQGQDGVYAVVLAQNMPHKELSSLGPPPRESGAKCLFPVVNYTEDGKQKCPFNSKKEIDLSRRL